MRIEIGPITPTHALRDYHRDALSSDWAWMPSVGARGSDDGGDALAYSTEPLSGERKQQQGVSGSV